jgi:alkylated DNA repair dioxygenase AlkB
MPDSPLFPSSGELLPSDGSAVLVPDFFSPPEADNYFSALLKETPWEQHSFKMFGKHVLEPRLSAWHADPEKEYTYSGQPRTPMPWNKPLTAVRLACEVHIGHSFNGALVNLYRSGADAMGWHSDDEPINGVNPVIASISLGAERRFDLRHKRTRDVVSAVLPHGSLLVMSGACQTNWHHRVAKTTRETDPRINVTFRFLCG